MKQHPEHVIKPARNATRDVDRAFKKFMRRHGYKNINGFEVKIGGKDYERISKCV